MKVVLDTNVLVCGLISPTGPCGRILRLFVEGVFQPCVDERMLAEYQDVLPRPELQIDPEDVIGTLELIRETAEAVAALPLLVRLPHEDDRPFLEVASTTDAILITGNKRHYPKRSRGEAVVVDCPEFLDRLARGGREK